MKLKNEIVELKEKECKCEKVKGSQNLKFSEAVKKENTVILKPKKRKTKLILKTK